MARKVYVVKVWSKQVDQRVSYQKTRKDLVPLLKYVMTSEIVSNDQSTFFSNTDPNHKLGLFGALKLAMLSLVLQFLLKQRLL